MSYPSARRQESLRLIHIFQFELITKIQAKKSPAGGETTASF
jgi:hypothetical protein